MEILLLVITATTIEIGTISFYSRKYIYLSEKNNFGIIISTFSRSEESSTVWQITNNCATNFSQNSWPEIVCKWERTSVTCLLSEYEHRYQNALRNCTPCHLMKHPPQTCKLATIIVFVKYAYYPQYLLMCCVYH